MWAWNFWLNETCSCDCCLTNQVVVTGSLDRLHGTLSLQLPHGTAELLGGAPMQPRFCDGPIRIQNEETQTSREKIKRRVMHKQPRYRRCITTISVKNNGPEWYAYYMLGNIIYKQKQMCTEPMSDKSRMVIT